MTKKYYINAIASIAPDGKVSDNGIFNTIEPNYKDIIQNANMRRRMSRIIKMGVAGGLTCLNEQNTTSADSIITATGLGCLVDTEKFLNAVIENNEEMLNPTAFIQSTFNTIGSQIALLIGSHSYNNTFVHRGLSFESALIDSMMRINEGDKNSLVGAIDEVTPASHIIMKRLGLLNGIIAGEGANFFLLSDEKNANTYARLCDVQTHVGKIEEEKLAPIIDRFLKRNGVAKENINILMTGHNGNTEQDKLYDYIENDLFAHSAKTTFKNTCGEYMTASSYAMWKASNLLKEKSGETQYLLIYNHWNRINHSLILLASC